MAKRGRHNEHHEEHADETWLIPYSDMLTLLLALFIVLYASAQIDQKKFDQIAQAFSNAFRGNTSIFENQRSIEEMARHQPTTTETVPNVVSGTSGRGQAYLAETAQLLEAKQMLDKYIAENNLAGDLHTELLGEGLMIRIKDTALFTSGSAQLLPESRRIAAEIAKMLLPLNQRVSVHGHTDNVPINTWEFPSNWELSSKRALNFMRFLLAQEPTLKPERFSATGYGEHRPISTNNTEEGRAKNRRVEVLIMRNYKQPEQ